MTRNALWLLLAIGSTSQAAAADATWQGTLHCDIIPNVLTKPLVQPLEIDVKDGAAHYQRTLMPPDTTPENSFQESGAGQVGADGQLTLTGVGIAAAGTYQSEYTGPLPEDSAVTRLAGHQLWSVPGQPPYDRPCDISLHKLPPRTLN